MVYVISQNGQPLMPTNRCGHIRWLLKTKQAKVIKRCPFTIQLLIRSTEYTQPIQLGVDAGSKHIGLSATTKHKVLYEADVELRTNIVNLLSVRREMRRARRHRKTRYRKARFNNRVRSKNKGWLAPSIENKIQTHFKVIDDLYQILPITNIVVEVASFDIQKIKKPSIEGAEYQQGEQLNFWNVREYVLFRDGHTCQCCKGKSKDKVLNVHHIESRKTGGDTPSNLITLCETCHTEYHQGKIKLPEGIKRGMKFNDATFMGVMRWTFYNRLKGKYPHVSLTYGYLTKNTRIQYGLPKEHYIDARCISGNPEARGNDVYYICKVRCHNRQIHKMTILHGGIRKRNQAGYITKGYRLFDKVIYKQEECFITGRRVTGSFMLKRFDGTKVTDGISYKKLKLLETGKHYVIERRQAIPPTAKASGFPCL